jgi:Xaa-Pro aminopeptidase
LKRTTVAGKPSKAKQDLLRLGRETTDFVAEIGRAGLGGVEWMKRTNEFLKERMKTNQYSIAHPDPVMFIGHGMGLDMEALWYVPGADMKLQEGMVLSIEPWIRVAGLGASRFEDLMLVAENRGELLNKYRFAI